MTLSGIPETPQAAKMSSTTMLRMWDVSNFLGDATVTGQGSHGAPSVPSRLGLGYGSGPKAEARSAAPDEPRGRCGSPQ